MASILLEGMSPVPVSVPAHTEMRVQSFFEVKRAF